MTTESSVDYSTGEIEEMKIIFTKFDADQSGILNEYEFTQALQLMEYKYNPNFIDEILKLVFDNNYETKHNNITFDDFIEFMSEFECVHYEVIDKIELILKNKNLNTNTDTDTSTVINLLKYVQMKNGSLIFADLHKYLNDKQNITNLSSQNKDNQIIQNIVNNEQKVEINDEEDNNINEISNQLQSKLSNPFQQQSLLKPINIQILEMNNKQIIECLNDDDIISNQFIKQQSVDIIKQQSWDGIDLIKSLKINKINEIESIFHNIQNYEYIIQSINKLNPSDINCEQLIQNLERMKQQKQQNSMELQLPQPPKQLQLQPSPTQRQMTQNLSINKPLSPPKQTRSLSIRSKTIIDADDEAYTQNVWKQILRFFDEDNDGTIDIKEMAPALRALGIDVNDNKLNNMINKMDQDQSGTIDYAEFKNYYQTLFTEKLKNGLDWDHIQQIFEKYDADSSGFLDINEFSFALKKICMNITDQDIKSILHLIDSSGDNQIEFDEFLQFLESSHPKAEWILKKIIRSSIPQPIEHLTAFKGVPTHFRKSELAELSLHDFHGNISEFIKPKLDKNGVTLQNIKINPKTSKIQRKFPQYNDDIKEKEINDNNIDTDNKENIDDLYLQNIRAFKLIDCSGVSLPEASIAARIIDRRVRVCLYKNNKPISNVFTIPAAWKHTEEDQWKFGSNIWKDSESNTVSEWNIFCTSIEPNLKEKIELFIELCILIKPSQSLKSGEIFKKSPVSISSQNNINNRQSSLINNNNSIIPHCSEPVEMSCGWCKLEIHSTNSNISHGINRVHKLTINGGSFNNETNVNVDDIRNDRKTSISFRKLKQALIGVESIITIQEQSYYFIKNKEYISWLPINIITALSNCEIIKLYFEIIGDSWLKNQEMFTFPFYKQNLYQSLLLYIINKPNLLCILIDEWKLKLKTYWKSQKNNNDFILNEFKLLLKKFIPLLCNTKIIQNPLSSLNQERLGFVKQIINGNSRQILNGIKPNSAVSIVYAPFTTDLFVQKL